MAKEKKSVIEDALLEVGQIEEALKSNTKEILAATMKQEIKESVKESILKEDDNEDEIEDVVDDLEVDDTDVDGDESAEELDIEVPTEEPIGDDAVEDAIEDLEGVGGEAEVDVEVDVEPELDLDVDELDLTTASDEDVVKVFKKLSDEDEIEVVKSDDVIELKDGDSEYRIELGGEAGIDLDTGKLELDLDTEPEAGLDIDLGLEGGEEEIDLEDLPESDEPIYEIIFEACGMKKHDVEESEESVEESEEVTEEEVTEGEEVTEEDKVTEETEEVTEEDVAEGEEQVDEVKSTTKVQKTPLGGKGRGVKPSTQKESFTRTELKQIVSEHKELKSKNGEYKEALKVFRDKLNEVALFNTNLAYATRLFTEHSTTKKEKMDILKRFDNVSSLKESKTLYKSITTELEGKPSITESVEKEVNKTIEGGSSEKLNESKVYVDPQVANILNLMEKLG